MSDLVSGQKFVELAGKSGILTQDELDSAVSAISHNGELPSDADTIADWLVQNDTLTRWQANKLKAGKHKGMILGKYKLLDMIGSGAMGTVYLAQHTLMHRRCAIKVLPPELVDQSSHLERFLREAEAIGKLNHPNIVQAYDIYQESEGDRDVYFIAMEYVQGVDVKSLVQREDPFDIIRAVDIARQVTNGLTHAHESGLVHRDIKPDNLLIDENGVVKILDLGLAFFFDQADESSVTLANSESLLGTADYISPEQSLNSHDVDHRSDIYSLGCTLYFMLTGHAPFNEGTVAMRLAAHSSKQPPAIRNERPEVPVELVEVVERMLEKEPEDRYQSCAELSQVLTKWIAENAGENWEITNDESVHDEHSPADPNADTTVGKNPVLKDHFSESDLSIVGKTEPPQRTSKVVMLGGVLAIVALAIVGVYSSGIFRGGGQPNEIAEAPPVQPKDNERIDVDDPVIDPVDPTDQKQEKPVPPSPTFLFDDQGNRWRVVSTKGGEVKLHENSQTSQTYLRLNLPDDESGVRASMQLKKPVVEQPFNLQIDWRAHQYGKASNVLSFSGLDINFPVFRIQTVGGKNRITLSDGADQVVEIDNMYETLHWYRIAVSVEAADLTRYHVKITDRGLDNEQDVFVWYNTRESTTEAPRLIKTDRPNQRVFTAGYPGQGLMGHFFDIDNLQVDVPPKESP